MFFTSHIDILYSFAHFEPNLNIFHISYVTSCKECRAEARMKIENREKEVAGLMGAWNHAQYAGERESEREETQKLYSKKLFNLHFNLHVCVFNAHFYTSSYKD